MDDEKICKVITEDGRIVVKMPKGDEIPRVISTTTDQDVNYARAGYCRVTLEIWAKVDD